MPESETSKNIVPYPSVYWSYRVYEKDQETGEVILIESVERQRNQTVENYALICSGLLISDATFSGGITWAEVGTGDAGWGGSPPAPASSTTALTTPLARRQPFSVTYLDGSNNATTTPTDKVRISFLLDFAQSDVDNNYIREYALFGGSATATLSSGTMFCVLRQPEQFKVASTRFVFDITIEFAAP